MGVLDPDRTLAELGADPQLGEAELGLAATGLADHEGRLDRLVALEEAPGRHGLGRGLGLGFAETCGLEEGQEVELAARGRYAQQGCFVRTEGVVAHMASAGEDENRCRPRPVSTVGFGGGEFCRS